MKKKIVDVILIGIVLLQFTDLFSQSLRPTAVPAAGGISTGGGNTLSWTLGEPFQKTLQSSNVTLTLGFQQPYILLKILSLKVFLQGFYSSNGLMRPLLYSNLLNSDQTACDSITVELHNVTTPQTIVAFAKDILHTDGNATFKFPSSIGNNAYYVVIRHRNSLETWSKNPILFSAPVVSLDLTSP